MRRWASCAALVLAAGCGKKGPVHPPVAAPRVAVADFKVARWGDRIVLRFTVPQRYPDGRPYELAAIEVLGRVIPAKEATAAETAAAAPVMAVAEYLADRPPLPETREAGRALTGAAGARPRLAEPSVTPVAVARVTATDLRRLGTYEARDLPARTTEGAIDLALDAPAGDGQLALAVAIRGRRPHDQGSLSEVRTVSLGERSEAPAAPRVESLERGISVAAPNLATWAVFRRRVEARGFAPAPVAAIADGATWLDPNVPEGRELCYAVARVITPDEAYSALSAEVCVTRVDRFPPEAPRELSALPSGEGILLLWKPSVSTDVAAYRVYRAVADGAFAVLATLERDQGSYLDATVSAGRRYRYRVTALDGATPANESEAGAEVSEAALPRQ